MELLSKTKKIRSVLEPWSNIVFPKNIHRWDLADLICSQKFAREHGLSISRRKVLQSIAITCAVGPALVKPTLAQVSLVQAGGVRATLRVILTAIELANNAWEIYEKIAGILTGANQAPRGQNGTILINVETERSVVEDARVFTYQVPPSTDYAFTFRDGPAAINPGMKIAAAYSANDEAYTAFRAYES